MHWSRMIPRWKTSFWRQVFSKLQRLNASLSFVFATRWDGFSLQSARCTTSQQSLGQSRPPFSGCSLLRGCDLLQRELLTSGHCSYIFFLFFSIRPFSLVWFVCSLFPSCGRGAFFCDDTRPGSLAPLAVRGLLSFLAQARRWTFRLGPRSWSPRSSANIGVVGLLGVYPTTSVVQGNLPR